jgi:simple sugar transport system permease protein
MRELAPEHMRHPSRIIKHPEDGKVVARSVGDRGPQATVTSAPSRLRRLMMRPEFGVVIAAGLLYGFFAVIAGGNGFITEAATAGWITAAAEIGIIALGAGSLMIAGEFDLSVGSMVGASSAIMGIVVGNFGLSVWIAVGVVLVFATVVGLVNAFVVLRTKLPSFIVTLAMMLILSGAALGTTRLLTNTTVLTVDSDGFAHTVFGGSVSALTATVFWWVGIAGVMTWVLGRAVFGNWIYAVGGDIDSAVTNGVPVVRVKTTLFVFSSVAAALVGVLQSVQFSSGDATRGSDFVFSAVAAAVIGGVLLTGGYGSAVGVVFGAVTYGIVSVGIFYTGWPTDWTSAFLGGLVFLAVFANNYFRKLALAGGSR